MGFDNFQKIAKSFAGCQIFWKNANYMCRPGSVGIRELSESCQICRQILHSMLHYKNNFYQIKQIVKEIF